MAKKKHKTKNVKSTKHAQKNYKVANEPTKNRREHMCSWNVVKKNGKKKYIINYNIIVCPYLTIKKACPKFFFKDITCTSYFLFQSLPGPAVSCNKQQPVIKHIKKNGKLK